MRNNPEFDEIETLAQLRTAIETHVRENPDHGYCACLDQAVWRIRRQLFPTRLYEQVGVDRRELLAIEGRIGHVLRLASRT